MGRLQIIQFDFPLLEDKSYFIWKNPQMLSQEEGIVNQCQP
jgi:hypothetical protein